MTSHFDVVVLGAGPGGYVAAIRAAQLGLKTAVIEEKYWGGVCLNVGCIPSKALLHNAELAHTFHTQAATFGISGEVSFDYGVAFDRSRQVAEGRVKGVHYLMKKNGITEYDGRGTFRDANTIDVAKADGSTETVTFDNAIIATGARVRLLPGVELSQNVVTYETLIMSRDLPRSIAIVGAGAIGMEFAYVLRNYGVEVTIIEFLDRALPNEDVDVSKEITKQ
jgi:dihydrolipoamide dehydrogenase